MRLRLIDVTLLPLSPVMDKQLPPPVSFPLLLPLLLLRISQSLETAPIVIDGYLVDPDSPFKFPFHVQLAVVGRSDGDDYDDYDDYDIFCGGTLISEDTVLTAAHCMLNASTCDVLHPGEEVTVVAGMYDLTEVGAGPCVWRWGWGVGGSCLKGIRYVPTRD